MKKYTAKNLKQIRKEILQLATRVRTIGNELEHESDKIQRKSNPTTLQVIESERMNYKADYIFAAADELESAAAQVFYSSLKRS